MSPVRVDWDQIKSAWPGDETSILFLDTRSRHIILSAFQVFTWKATYYHSQTADDDWDEIQRIMSDAEYELGVAMPISQLIPYIDELETLLRQISAKTCCASSIFTQQPSGIAPNTGTDIQYLVGDPPATYGDQVISTWDDWADYKCEAAHLLVEEVAIKFEQLAGLNADYAPGDVTVEMIGWVISKLTPLLIFINLAWDVFQAITGIGWELIGDFSTAAGQIRAAAQTIACEISKGDGAKDTAARFEAACKAAVTTAAGDLLLSAMPWEAWANIIYTGVAKNINGDDVMLTDVLPAVGTNDCCGPVQLQVIKGTGLSGYRTFTINSELNTVPDPDSQEVGIRFRNNDLTGFIEVNLLSLSTVPGINNDGAGTTYNLYDIDGNLVYSGDSPPTLPIAIRSFSLYDQRTSGAPTAYTVTVTWEVA